MTEPVVDEQKGAQATLRQIAASNPNLSVFVSANAGTGKTQVLTMRVLRLLLSGISPETILCVTYTKAAAAEMKSRLYKQLSIWAICDQTDLLFELKKLGEDKPLKHSSKQLVACLRISLIMKMALALKLFIPFVRLY